MAPPSRRSITVTACWAAPTWAFGASARRSIATDTFLAPLKVSSSQDPQWNRSGGNTGAASGASDSGYSRSGYGWERSEKLDGVLVGASTGVGNAIECRIQRSDAIERRAAQEQAAQEALTSGADRQSRQQSRDPLGPVERLWKGCSTSGDSCRFQVCQPALHQHHAVHDVFE